GLLVGAELAVGVGGDGEELPAVELAEVGVGWLGPVGEQGVEGGAGGGDHRREIGLGERRLGGVGQGDGGGGLGWRRGGGGGRGTAAGARQQGGKRRGGVGRVGGGGDTGHRRASAAPEKVQAPCRRISRKINGRGACRAGISCATGGFCRVAG